MPGLCQARRGPGARHGLTRSGRADGLGTPGSGMARARDSAHSWYTPNPFATPCRTEMNQTDRVYRPI